MQGMVGSHLEEGLESHWEEVSKNKNKTSWGRGWGKGRMRRRRQGDRLRQPSAAGTSNSLGSFQLCLPQLCCGSCHMGACPQHQPSPQGTRGMGRDGTQPGTDRWRWHLCLGQGQPGLLPTAPTGVRDLQQLIPEAQSQPGAAQGKENLLGEAGMLYTTRQVPLGVLKKLWGLVNDASIQALKPGQGTRTWGCQVLFCARIAPHLPKQLL